MEVLYGVESVTDKHRNAIVALGFFDGFHRGHQALVHQAKRLASSTQTSTPVLVYTFDRHPLEIVNPGKAPRLLTTSEEKIKLALELPIDAFLIGKFDHSLSLLEPSAFVKEIVADTLRPHGMVIGYSYRYGKGHQGDAKSLVEEGNALKISVTVVNPVMVEGTAVSSSWIRQLLIEGQVEKAGLLLGRLYRIGGKVVQGKGRGKGLGIPTANLDVPDRKLIPKAGIYAGRIHLEGTSRQGLISIGHAPTFGPGKLVTEAFLFDFTGDLYGKRLEIEFMAWRREQKKFAGAEDLSRAMKEDVAWGRDFFASTPHP